MAGYYRPNAHVERSRPHDSGAGWTVLWETRKLSDDARWSAAPAGSEADALERAQHFLRLGFFVHAITDPLGAVVMDAAAIAGRFGAKAKEEINAEAKEEI